MSQKIIAAMATSDKPTWKISKMAIIVQMVAVSHFEASSKMIKFPTVGDKLCTFIEWKRFYDDVLEVIENNDEWSEDYLQKKELGEKLKKHDDDGTILVVWDTSESVAPKEIWAKFLTRLWAAWKDTFNWHDDLADLENSAKELSASLYSIKINEWRVET